MAVPAASPAARDGGRADGCRADAHGRALRLPATVARRAAADRRRPLAGGSRHVRPRRAGGRGRGRGAGRDGGRPGRRGRDAERGTAATATVRRARLTAAASGCDTRPHGRCDRRRRAMSSPLDDLLGGLMGGSGGAGGALGSLLGGSKGGSSPLTALLPVVTGMLAGGGLGKIMS